MATLKLLASQIENSLFPLVVADKNRIAPWKAASHFWIINQNSIHHFTTCTTTTPPPSPTIRHTGTEQAPIFVPASNEVPASGKKSNTRFYGASKIESILWLRCPTIIQTNLVQQEKNSSTGAAEANAKHYIIVLGSALLTLVGWTTNFKKFHSKFYFWSNRYIESSYC